MMTPEDFRSWRKKLKLSQESAAQLLGISRNSVAYYEKGERDGGDRAVVIPKTVELACTAILAGLTSYDDISNDAVELDIREVMKGTKLPKRILEWCQETLQGALVVNDGIAYFQRIEEAALFKITFL